MDIADADLFMMCDKLNTGAFGALPEGFHFRYCREDELDLWMSMPFDDPNEALAYRGFMRAWYDDVYAPFGSLFFENCLFACTQEDIPAATCFIWKAYGSVSTVHWLKVLKSYEDRGLGRAILTAVLEPLRCIDFPVYLHTHPANYRAIGLYADFGFCLLTDPVIGGRRNAYPEAATYLETHMTAHKYRSLMTAKAPTELHDAIAMSDVVQF